MTIPTTYQIVINNYETRSIQMRFKEGSRYLGTHLKKVSDMVSEGHLTQEEAVQIETLLRKMTTSYKAQDSISFQDLVISPVSIS